MGGGGGVERSQRGGKAYPVGSALVGLPDSTATAATVKCFWLGPWARHFGEEDSKRSVMAARDNSR